MTKTTSFRHEGPMAPCSKCGNLSGHAAVHRDGLCYRCLTDSFESVLPKHLHCPRTAMQRHSNYMLFMRRMMKGIAEVLVIENAPWPEYARIGHCAMRKVDDGYWRDNGRWGCKAERQKGILVAVTGQPPINPLDGRPVVEVTKEEWEEENGEHYNR